MIVTATRHACLVAVEPCLDWAATSGFDRAGRGTTMDELLGLLLCTPVAGILLVVGNLAEPGSLPVGEDSPVAGSHLAGVGMRHWR